MRLFSDRLESGLLDEALGHLDAHDRLAEQRREPHRPWWSRYQRASLHVLRGQFDEAERLLTLADRHTRGVTYAQEWTLTLTAAQVHATLALAAATAVGTAGPDLHAWADVAATRPSATACWRRLDNWPPGISWW